MKIALMTKSLILLFLFGISQLSFASGGGSKVSASKYYLLSPPIVVNVNDKGRVRHLQISIQFRLDDPSEADLVQEHKPAIQHELVMLLSGREATDVRSVKGKEELRTKATEVLQNILQESTGKTLINAVYFTAFVIQ